MTVLSKALYWVVLLSVISFPSLLFGIIIGRGQQQFIEHQKREQSVSELISSRSEYKDIKFNESSSCHLYIHGTVSSNDVLDVFLASVQSAIGTIKMETVTISVKIHTYK
jgi:hypothetical protein